MNMELLILLSQVRIRGFHGNAPLVNMNGRFLETIEFQALYAPHVPIKCYTLMDEIQ